MDRSDKSTGKLSALSERAKSALGVVGRGSAASLRGIQRGVSDVGEKIKNSQAGEKLGDEIETRKTIKRATEAHERGNHAMAYRLLAAKAAEKPDDERVIEAFWETAIRCEQTDEAIPALARLVRGLAGRGEVEPAAQLWRDLRGATDAGRIGAPALVRIAPALLEVGSPEASARALQEAVDPSETGLTPGLAARIVELSRESAPGVALRAARFALESPDMHEAKRGKLETLISELRAAGVSEPEDLPVQEIAEPPVPAATPAPSKAAPAKPRRARVRRTVAKPPSASAASPSAGLEAGPATVAVPVETAEAVASRHDSTPSTEPALAVPATREPVVAAPVSPQPSADPVPEHAGPLLPTPEPEDTPAVAPETSASPERVAAAEPVPAVAAVPQAGVSEPGSALADEDDALIAELFPADDPEPESLDGDAPAEPIAASQEVEPPQVPAPDDSLIGELFPGDEPTVAEARREPAVPFTADAPASAALAPAPPASAAADSLIDELFPTEGEKDGESDASAQTADAESVEADLDAAFGEIAFGQADALSPENSSDGMSLLSEAEMLGAAELEDEPECESEEESEPEREPDQETEPAGALPPDSEPEAAASLASEPEIGDDDPPDLQVTLDDEDDDEPLDAAAFAELVEDAIDTVEPTRRFEAIKLTEGMPVGLSEATLSLRIRGGRAARVDLSRVQAVSISEVRGPADPPFFVVDLLLNWESEGDATLRSVRMRGDAFDARMLIEAPDTPGDALAVFVRSLVERADAVALPDGGAAIGVSIPTFESLEEYERAVLQVNR